MNIYLQNSKVDQDLEFEHRIKEIETEIERIAPNVRAVTK